MQPAGEAEEDPFFADDPPTAQVPLVQRAPSAWGPPVAVPGPGSRSREALSLARPLQEQQRREEEAAADSDHGALMPHPPEGAPPPPGRRHVPPGWRVSEDEVPHALLAPVEAEKVGEEELQSDVGVQATPLEQHMLQVQADIEAQLVEGAADRKPGDWIPLWRAHLETLDAHCPIIWSSLPAEPGSPAAQKLNAVQEVRWHLLLRLLALHRLEHGPRSRPVFLLHAQIASLHGQRRRYESIKPHADQARMLWSHLQEEARSTGQQLGEGDAELLQHVLLLRCALSAYWADKGKGEEAWNWLHRARRAAQALQPSTTELQGQQPQRKPWERHLHLAELLCHERAQAWPEALTLYQGLLADLEAEADMDARATWRVYLLQRIAEMHTKRGDIPNALASTLAAYEAHLQHRGWRVGEGPKAVAMALDVASTSLQHRLPLQRPRALLVEGLPHLDVVEDWKLVYKGKMLLWTILHAEARYDEALHLLRPFEQEVHDREGPNSMRHVEVQLCKALTLLALEREPAALTTLQRTFRTHKATCALGIPRIRERMLQVTQVLGTSKMQRYCKGNRTLQDVCKLVQQQQ